MRNFRDTEGRSWRVWHVRPQSDVLRAGSSNLAGGWLCFEREGEKRRLANPPADWDTIPESELEPLLRQPSLVKKVKV
jgi:hypothetical protein